MLEFFFKFTSGGRKPLLFLNAAEVCSRLAFICDFKVAVFCQSFTDTSDDVSAVVIEMGKALQHRGQNGGGIAVKPKGKLIKVYKEAKAFNDIFKSVDLLDIQSLRGEDRK